MTPEQIKKIIRKCELVEIYREPDDGDEITIEVYYTSSPAERARFNPMTGDGHPGSRGEIEIVLALDPNKNEVELTEREREQAIELAFESEEVEDAPDSSDREDFERD